MKFSVKWAVSVFLFPDPSLFNMAVLVRFSGIEMMLLPKYAKFELPLYSDHDFVVTGIYIFNII
jgi:hypothetical protein